MRASATGDTDSDSSFGVGVIFGVAMVVAFAGFVHLTQTILTMRFGGIVQWWTTEQTLTYVPADVVFQSFGPIFLVLCIFAFIGFLTHIGGAGL